MRIFLLLLFICPSAFAAYSEMIIEGVKQSNGVWTAAGVMDTSGFVRTTGAVTVSGHTASTAVSLAVERNIAKTTFRGVVNKLGPYGVAAAGAYEVYDWLSKGDGTQPELIPCEPSSPIWCHPADSTGYDDSYQYGVYYEACSGMICIRGSTPRDACTTFLGTDDIKITSITSDRCNLAWASDGRPNGYLNHYKYSCNQTVSVPSCKFEIDPNKPKPTPIAGDYFNSYPDPSLPVMADGFNNIPALRDGGIPISSTKFNPYSEWLGDPYFKDGNWFRDRMDVSPSPAPGQPTRVRVDYGPVKLEGMTDPTVKPDDTPASENTQPKEQTKFCDDNPQSIACVELGQLEDEPITLDERPFHITPESPWGQGSASCPNPETETLRTGATVTFSYQPTCDFFSSIRPAVIAVAFLAALYIALGIPAGKGN